MTRPFAVRPRFRVIVSGRLSTPQCTPCASRATLAPSFVATCASRLRIRRLIALSGGSLTLECAHGSRPWRRRRWLHSLETQLSLSTQLSLATHSARPQCRRVRCVAALTVIRALTGCADIPTCAVRVVVAIRSRIVRPRPEAPPRLPPCL